MYQPMFTLDAKGIPIISNDEIDTLGERLVADFSPLDIFTPKAIDIDRFVTKYLKLKQDFYYLSHCGVYLGTTIFQETHRLPVFNPETISAEYAHVEAGTVIIDSSLMVDNQEHRYRFTMGHEGGILFYILPTTLIPLEWLMKSVQMLMCAVEQILKLQKMKPCKETIIYPTNNV